MSDSWFAQELRGRFERYQRHRDAFPVSIKLRVVSGCFDCGGCNPHMRDYLDRLNRDGRQTDECEFERHESGPEWIIYIAAGTAVVTLAKSVIELITATIKARSDGQKKGDKDKNRIELIVRGFDPDGNLFEEKVLKFDAGDTATEQAVKKSLIDGVTKHLPAPKHDTPAPTAAPVTPKTTAKKQTKKSGKRKK